MPSVADPLAAARVHRSAGGLTTVVLSERRVPLVATALWFRVGTRDEEPGEGGIAHFLEHMMFKGSEGYPPGAVDRRTQLLGGTNNAFTSHDATVYHFAFASDRWQEALRIEADRMAGLTLAPEEVECERRVILEEISMVEDDPWGSLEERVAAELFGEHPYGLPVLGTRGAVGATGGGELRRFHQQHYRPGNAVLAVVGNVEESEALAAIDDAFAPLARRLPAGSLEAESARVRRPVASPGVRRVELERGEVPRLFLALPAPAVEDPDHPVLRLVLGLLTSGRSSRLQSALVEDGQLAAWLSADVADTVEPGLVSLLLEVVPGEDPARAEAVLCEGLEALGRRPPEPEEVERARSILRTEWILGHERLHQRALTLGSAAAFQELDFPRRYREAIEAATPERMVEVASRWLTPSRDAVVGWSGRKVGRR